MFHRIRRHWDILFPLHCERSVWIEQEDLGSDIVIRHRNTRYRVKIPKRVNRNLIVRLRGLGRTKRNKTGDLLLHISLNKGDNIKKRLWISETSARIGAEKILVVDEKRLQMVIPPNSYEGLTIRGSGLGRKRSFCWRAPFLDRKRGDLLVKLIVYPDSIAPEYGSFGNLSTDDMFLEGWVYRKMDEVIEKMGESSFRVNPLQADEIADLFNEHGWRSICHALASHLDLAHVNIEYARADSKANPGGCRRTAISQYNTPATNKYIITINEQFLDNPFSIAAIIAHELCHVVYSESINDKPVGALKTEQAILEEERTVDLLVFMFKLGEFQLRVARDKRFTLGYFNQDIFERIQVIATRGLNSH